MSRNAEDLTAEILAAAVTGYFNPSGADGEKLGRELAKAFKTLHAQIKECKSSRYNAQLESPPPEPTAASR